MLGQKVTQPGIWESDVFHSLMSLSGCMWIIH